MQPASMCRAVSDSCVSSMQPSLASYFGLTAALAIFLAGSLSAAVVVTGEARQPDGRPFAGVVVELLRNRDRAAASVAELSGLEPQIVEKARTDAKGHFRLGAPNPGMWTLVLSAPGHLAIKLDLVPLLENLDLSPVALEPSDPVLLSVVDSHGKPVPGVMMRTNRAPSAASSSEDSPWYHSKEVSKPDVRGALVVSKTRGENLPVKVFAPGYREASMTLRDATHSRLEDAVGGPRTITLVEASGAEATGVAVRAGEGEGWPIGISDAQGQVALPAGTPRPLFSLASAGRRIEVGAAAPPVVEVVGEVHQRITGEPIRDAVVWLSDDPGVWAITDRRGAYTLTVPSEPSTVLRVAAAGHFSGQLIARGLAKVRDGTAAFSSATRVFLDPMGVLAGSVYDKDGAPIPGATIKASVREMSDILSTAVGAPPSVRTASEESGRFRLKGLARGVIYDLWTDAPGFALQQMQIALPRENNPQPDLRIVLDRGLTMRGRIVDGDGRPLAASVRLVSPKDPQQRLRAAYGDPSRAEGTATFSTATDPDGFFELRELPPGRFDLVAVAPHFAPRTIPGVEVKEGDSGLDVGTLYLNPGATVSGTVSDASGRPLAAVRVVAYALRPTGSVPGFSSYGHGVGDVITDGSGHFSLSDLIPGEKVSLELRLEGFIPEVLRGLTVPLADPLQVTLWPGASVHGRVVTPDGSPLGGARVQVVPIGQRPARELSHDLSTVSTADGSFTLRGLPPGESRLIASARGHLQKTTELVLVPGEDTSAIEVVLQSGLRIEGRVLNAQGEPVPGAFVQPRGASGTTTDVAGQYRLEGLPAGAVRLSAWHQLGQEEIQLVLQPPGAQADITLPQGATIDGRILDSQGSANPGVRIELSGSHGAGLRAVATSGQDGGFQFDSVGPGHYELRMRKEGFARRRQTLEVGTDPIHDLVLVLNEGGIIVGQLRGLADGEIFATRVSAQHEDVTLEGEVTADGTYRILNVEPGSYQVSVTTEERNAHGVVEVPASGREARLDLELKKEATLAARVLLNGTPAAGAFVRVTGFQDAMAVTSSVGHLGEARLGGLPDGDYSLEVAFPTLALTHSEKVRISGDTRVAIELQTGEMVAVVRDAESGSPIPDAVVRVTRVRAADEQVRSAAKVFRSNREGKSAPAILFKGSYLLEVTAKGYKPESTAVDLAEPSSTYVLLVDRTGG
jgi:carboxypeptidase family protein